MRGFLLGDLERLSEDRAGGLNVETAVPTTALHRFVHSLT